MGEKAAVREAIAQLRVWSAQPLKYMWDELVPRSYFERSDLVCDYAEQLEAQLAAKDERIAEAERLLKDIHGPQSVSGNDWLYTGELSEDEWVRARDAWLKEGEG